MEDREERQGGEEGRGTQRLRLAMGQLMGVVQTTSHGD